MAQNCALARPKTTNRTERKSHSDVQIRSRRRCFNRTWPPFDLCRNAAAAANVAAAAGVGSERACAPA